MDQLETITLEEAHKLFLKDLKWQILATVIGSGALGAVGTTIATYHEQGKTTPYGYLFLGSTALLMAGATGVVSRGLYYLVKSFSTAPDIYMKEVHKRTLVRPNDDNVLPLRR